jgi:hypothetical protein
MAEAKRLYSDHKIVAMARYIARRAVEEEIRQRGGKVAHYSARALYELADDYIALHREAVMREVVMRRWERWLSPMRHCS